MLTTELIITETLNPALVYQYGTTDHGIEIQNEEITSKVTNHPLKGDKTVQPNIWSSPPSIAEQTSGLTNTVAGNQRGPCLSLTLCQISQWQSEH